MVIKGTPVAFFQMPRSHYLGTRTHFDSVPPRRTMCMIEMSLFYAIVLSQGSDWVQINSTAETQRFSDNDRCFFGGFTWSQEMPMYATSQGRDTCFVLVSLGLANCLLCNEPTTRHRGNTTACSSRMCTASSQGNQYS